MSDRERNHVVTPEDFMARVKGLFGLIKSEGRNPTVREIERVLKSQRVAYGNQAQSVSDILQELRSEPDSEYAAGLLARQAAARIDDECIQSSPMGSLGEEGSMGKSTHRLTDSDGEYKP